MKPVRIVSGVAAPLDRSDVDTDQIIPASWLKRVERTGFGEGLFSSWRQSDPDFVLNRKEFAGASILVAGPNFGTGSSREHAVWALMDAGFEAVISPRFGDIFRNNATKSGLIPVQVDGDIADLLIKAATEEPGMIVTIDIENKTLSVPEIGVHVKFPMDDYTQYQLVNGLDEVGLTLRHGDDITEFERHRSSWLPVTIGEQRS